MQEQAAHAGEAGPSGPSSEEPRDPGILVATFFFPANGFEEGSGDWHSHGLGMVRRS